MGDHEHYQPVVPPWVHSLGVAAWIRGSDGNISFMNSRAEALLGMGASDCIGQPCYCVVRGRSHDGEAVCGPDCPIASLAERGVPLEPVDMQIPWPAKSGRHIRVLTIAIDTPGHKGMSLVHCAFCTEREHRSMQYLRRVISRDADCAPGSPEVYAAPLTGREQEILELLVADRSLHAIAAELHVSHATVRNHVQHILAKLGVHSIIEAVAVCVLTAELGGACRTD